MNSSQNNQPNSKQTNAAPAGQPHVLTNSAVAKNGISRSATTFTQSAISSTVAQRLAISFTVARQTLDCFANDRQTLDCSAADRQTLDCSAVDRQTLDCSVSSEQSMESSVSSEQSMESSVSSEQSMESSAVTQRMQISYFPPYFTSYYSNYTESNPYVTQNNSYYQSNNYFVPPNNIDAPNGNLQNNYAPQIRQNLKSSVTDEQTPESSVFAQQTQNSYSPYSTPYNYLNSAGNDSYVKPNYPYVALNYWQDQLNNYFVPPNSFVISNSSHDPQNNYPEQNVSFAEDEEFSPSFKTADNVEPGDIDLECSSNSTYSSDSAYQEMENNANHEIPDVCYTLTPRTCNVPLDLQLDMIVQDELGNTTYFGKPVVRHTEALIESSDQLQALMRRLFGTNTGSGIFNLFIFLNLCDLHQLVVELNELINHTIGNLDVQLERTTLRKLVNLFVSQWTDASIQDNTELIASAIIWNLKDDEIASCMLEDNLLGKILSTKEDLERRILRRQRPKDQ